MRPHWLSFGVGLLSLGQEMLWMRFFGYANHSVPQAMMAVLLFYLLGIAVGASCGRRYCLSDHQAVWRSAGVILLAAGAFDAVSLGALIWMVMAWGNHHIGLVLILISAALKSMIFPMAHHLGTPALGTKVGQSLSRVYAFNIAGATMGPVVASYGLLAIASTQQCLWLCTTGTIAIGLSCLCRERGPLASPRARLSTAGLTLFVGVIGVLMPDQLIRQVTSDQWGTPRRIIETRQGIIAVYPGGKLGDVVTGGNVYDGRTNLDPVVNSNGIDRLLMLSVARPKPKRVLMIGLSVGSWLKLVTTFPGIEAIDVVEINPGYLDLISEYPVQASALQDPRVRIHIDDGRRWLRSRAQKDSYDLVIMNTTWHWRAFITNMLSIEFLNELSKVMTPDALLAYNGTGSPDVLFTATKIFPFAYQFGNFIVASRTDFRSHLTDRNAAAHLRALVMDGHPLYPEYDRGAVGRLLSTPWQEIDTVRRAAGRELTVISDHNLATEYRHGRPFRLQEIFVGR